MIRVYHGPMYSGKTKELVREYGNGAGVLAIRPAIDNRYGANGRMYSKDHGYSAPAVSVDHTNPDAIINSVDKYVGLAKFIIDEVSFFPVEPFLKVVRTIADRDIEVVVGGLAYDAFRNPWGPILTLLNWSDVVEIALTAECDGNGRTCKEPAIWSYAKAKKKTQLEVGAEDLYGASCEDHYLQLHVSSK